MTIDSTPPADQRISLQRQCLATFMDAHPQAFAAPVQAVTWSDYISRERVPHPAERRTLDNALGMITATMRSVQMTMDDPVSLTKLFSRARELGYGEFEPDPGALAMVQQGNATDSEGATAYAQAVTVYRQCMANGAITGDELPRLIGEAFDELPTVTPLMRATVETAKRIAQIDVETMLASTGQLLQVASHAHH